MPMKEGEMNGRPYMMWGSRGTKRYYIKGNERSKAAAKKLVDKDRKRIEAFANR